MSYLRKLRYLPSERGREETKDYQLETCSSIQDEVQAKSITILRDEYNLKRNKSSGSDDIKEKLFEPGESNFNNRTRC